MPDARLQKTRKAYQEECACGYCTGTPWRGECCHTLFRFTSNYCPCPVCIDRFQLGRPPHHDPSGWAEIMRGG
jgi:hypothetical protein